jgi:hypothetical protein
MSCIPYFLTPTLPSPLPTACRYVDQGGGKRKGAFAVYMEPWHADIFEFLDLRKNHGGERRGWGWGGRMERAG